jgi:hypothetical protein
LKLKQTSNYFSYNGPTPVQALRADLNPNAVMRVKGIGVRIRSVLFLSANFEGRLDDGQPSRFGKPD